MTVYGYARVSTAGQASDGQLAELQAAGCDKILSETASGAAGRRLQLTKALKLLQAGDTLMVTRLDRLARSTRDLLNILAAVGEKGARFRSLRDVWADTTTPHGLLMITMLGGLAEFERSLIASRTGEGRERARARGVKVGRPSSLNTKQRAFVALAKRDGTHSIGELARLMDVHRATIVRVKKAPGAPAQLDLETAIKKRKRR